MPNTKQPLKPDDFPVNAEDKKIKKQDGTPVADTDDPAVAADIAERLNEDEAQREEDTWSALGSDRRVAAPPVTWAARFETMA